MDDSKSTVLVKTHYLKKCSFFAWYRFILHGCTQYDPWNPLKRCKTPSNKGVLSESSFSWKMNQFSNPICGSPFQSKVQVSYHFGKPKRRPFTWSNQIFVVASYFGEIDLHRSNILARVDKKAVLWSFWFLGHW